MWFSCIVLVLALCYTGMKAQESGFCYTEPSCGPSTWPGVCQTGQRQSPILLSQKQATKLHQAVVFRNYHKTADFILSANGIHDKIPTFMIEQSGDSYIEGGALPANTRYYFNQSHFHWANNDSYGSEHHIEGRRFVGEAHFVHFHQDYFTPQGVPAGVDQIAVVAFPMELQHFDNHHLQQYIDLLTGAQKNGPIANQSEAVLNEFEFAAKFDLILPSNYNSGPSYFHYEGSLTTPPCTETVSWIVMEDTIKISHGQVQSYFHEHYTDPGRQSTFRPMQPLNGRTVYFYRQFT